MVDRKKKKNGGNNTASNSKGRHIRSPPISCMMTISFQTGFV
jgi:hypothetical protein